MYEVGVGDTPMRISRKLNGNPYRYGELLAANPHKEITHVRGVPTFKSLGVGEQLIVPSGFVGDGFGLGANLVTLPKTYKSKGNQLLPGQYLDRGDALVTSNGGVLYMQPEGNLVLYGPNGKGQHTALWWTADHNTNATRAMVRSDGSLVMLDANGKSIGWDTQPIQRGRAARIVFQDDGNLVWYDANNKAVLDAQTNGWRINPGLAGGSGGSSIFKDFVKVIAAPITVPTHLIAEATKKIPLVGDITHIVDSAASAPANVATAIASGQRLDHVAVDAFKAQLKLVKEVAPYAQTVVSFVPGIGTGVAAAIGAGAALAEGQSITQAAKAAIRGALPGGPLAATAFDTALKVAGGANVAQAALEGARELLPSDAAKKAFDIGLAVVTGEKIQTALAKGLMSIAPGQLQAVLEAGQKALASTPGLATALKTVAPGGATSGFNLAAGLLSHTGLNEKALAAVRSQLPPDVVQGFDTALKTQVNHIAWLKNVVSAPVPATASTTPIAATLAKVAPKMPEPPKKVATAPKAPTMPEPPKKVAVAPPKKAPTMPEPPKKAPGTPAAAPARVAAAYAPYPSNMRQGGALSGCAPECNALGAPITDISGAMRHAGLSAVNGSKGRPRMVRSPDGKDYLFSLEGGTLIARQCFTSDTLDAPPHGGGHGGGHGGHGGGHGHGGRGRGRSFTRGGAGWRGTWWDGPWIPDVVTTVETCRTWSNPIEMTPAMQTAARDALNSSRGQPTTARGPDNVLYLFALENGAPTARSCAAVA